VLSVALLVSKALSIQLLCVTDSVLSISLLGGGTLCFQFNRQLPIFICSCVINNESHMVGMLFYRVQMSVNAVILCQSAFYKS
jgi:hypothetical protein